VAGVRAACEELFSLRALHSSPAEMTVFDSWPDSYRALAAELSFPTGDVQEAVEAVRQLIARIASA
jgi:hypothetical protein